MKFTPGCHCCATGNTTVSGRLLGCNSGGIEGTIEIKNGSTSLGTGTSDTSGNYTVSLTLSGNTTVTITGTSLSGRFNVVTITKLIGIGANGPTGFTIQLTGDPAYVCTVLCSEPLARSLNVVHTGGPPGTFQTPIVAVSPGSTWETTVGYDGNQWRIQAATGHFETTAGGRSSLPTVTTCYTSTTPLSLTYTNIDGTFTFTE